jgi:glycosyltransferase involved in cell wall biosynthesis
MRLLTGIDVPVGSPGGSIELLHDLYRRTAGPFEADVFMLAAAEDAAPPTATPTALLAVPGKQLSGPGFWTFVADLATAIRQRFDAADYGLMHLQHLAFGATPALLRAFPELPGIALVHGTDLLFAADHPTQAEVLREATAAARVVVVPTGAMVDHLRRLTPLDRAHIEHIPWGIPDELLSDPPVRRERDGDELRLLYAGRLTDEKGVGELLTAIGRLAGVRVSLAAPRAEYQRLAQRTDLSRVHYLGWLSRPDLWRCFAGQDVLVIPSTRLEAFGLVAVEAQACGLPVLYQPVPGLAEVVGDSGIPLHLPGATTERAAAMITDVLTWLGKDPAALEDVRRAGRRNAARFPLSRTVRELHALSTTLAS